MTFKLGQLEDDLVEPFKAWQTTPNPKTAGSLLRATTPMLDTAIKSYGGQNQSPLLRSRARQLALQAFQTYNPDRGTMKTHLLSQLQRLRREAADQQNIISVPEAVRLDFSNLLRQEQELADRLGRSPSDVEISDATGLSPKRLSYIRQYRGGVAEGSTERQMSDGTFGEAPQSKLPNHNPLEAWQSFVYYDLSDTDRTIMDLSLGRNGNPKLAVREIARRLGITPSAVSQRTAKIQQLIDARFTNDSIL